MKTKIDLIPPALIACTDDSIETVMVFDCPDQHVICVPCFEIFVKSRLNERQFTIDAETGYYTLGCPVGCENSLITHPKHFLAIISKEDYERYQRFATEGIKLFRGIFLNIFILYILLQNVCSNLVESYVPNLIVELEFYPMIRKNVKSSVNSVISYFVDCVPWVIILENALKKRKFLKQFRLLP